MLSRISTKTKPKQTQTKPIRKMPKINISSFMTSEYVDFGIFMGLKTKPKQSQSGVVCGSAGTSFSVSPQTSSGGQKE